MLSSQRRCRHSLVVITLIACSTILFRTATGQSQQRRPRPQARPTLVQEQISPRLEEILRRWEEASRRIRKLQGEHNRRVYDSVFEIEKRTRGRFYYEGPDKGRIDIEPYPIRPGDVSQRTGKLGKRYSLESGKQEKWICDGSQVKEVDEERKEVNVYPIPPHAQGENIMDGPLPFLFGMPAEKAKRRFKLKLVREGLHERTGRQIVHLQVKPCLEPDSQNWSEAQIILDSERFLPWDVQLKDPAGTTTTVFNFGKLRLNKRQGFWLDPFNPSFRGFRIVLARSPDVLPDVTGRPWRIAEKELKELGVKIRFLPGTRTTDTTEINRVEFQQPEPGTPIKTVETVRLYVYARPQKTARNEKRK